MSLWNKRPIGGVLLDVTGVLFESAPGGGVAIPGSVEAIKRFFDKYLLQLSTSISFHKRPESPVFSRYCI